MLTGCGLNYKTFVQISFLIFQFDHFGRWVPKKIFYLDMLRFTKHNLQPLVIYISWFLQRKSQAYSLTLFVIRAATLLVHTCQDATFGLITIAINLLIHPSHSKFSVMFFYCLPYNSCDGSLEDLVLDQLANPWLIFFSILITCLLDILPYLVSHGNFEIVKVKITVICKLADATWLLYKIEFHKSQKFHGFLNVSIMEGNYCK